MSQYTGYIQVNLSAVRHNWRFLNGHCGGKECGAVVKANAYGLGVAPVSQALFSEGCRSFFVATLGEAMEVRRLLPADADIYVLQGCAPGDAALFRDNDLIPVLISLEMVHHWVDSQDAPSHCAIKVNTGMNRLGLPAEDFLGVLSAEPELFSRANPRLLVSHLACADEPAHPLNQRQLLCFDRCLEAARQRVPAIRGSLANSAGILLGERWRAELARPGIALYGGRQGLSGADPIATVVSVYLPVLQVYPIKAGQSVGYGADYVASEDRLLAVVAGGYADGVPRSLAGSGKAWFHRELPLVGRVSMDSCVFDITDIPPRLRPNTGDFIELLGEHCDLDELAAGAGTIAYEILTGFGGRLSVQYRE